MSNKPIATLAGVSTVGGIMGYTMAGSVPSLLGGVGAGSLMAVAAMRIHDNLSYGFELAAASSAGLAVPMLKRAVRTRAPVPAAVALAALASTGYYTKEALEHADGAAPK